MCGQSRGRKRELFPVEFDLSNSAWPLDLIWSRMKGGERGWGGGGQCCCFVSLGEGEGSRICMELKSQPCVSEDFIASIRAAGGWRGVGGGPVLWPLLSCS